MKEIGYYRDVCILLRGGERIDFEMVSGGTEEDDEQAINEANRDPRGFVIDLPDGGEQVIPWSSISDVQYGPPIPESCDAA